jgi:hypothetical protein
MKQRRMLLVGLTAVSLLILLTSCATPTTPEAIVETAVPPTLTPQPTATTAPTATPQPTPTPTAEEQANQRLLADGRFTTLLDELTQEIGRDLSDAEQAQVLAMARALWLPDRLDESDWLPNPSGVTLHWRPTLDGREGPVVLVTETQPDSPYAAGAVIFWQGERLLSLTPGGVGYYFEFGRIQQNGWNFDTWVEYDAEGNIVSFVHLETMQYVTRESDDWSIFTLSDLDPQGNRVGDEFWWTNGGEPVRIDTGPGNVPIADYLADNPVLRLTQTEQNGQRMVALEDAETQELRYTLNPTTMQWYEVEPPEQPALAERQFYSDSPIVFTEDRRGIVRGILPDGVSPENLLTMEELDELAQAINFTPTYGCSADYEPDGRLHTLAVVVGHGTARIDYPGFYNTYEGYWLQTCGVGPDGQLVEGCA